MLRNGLLQFELWIAQVCPMCSGVLKPIETKFKICSCGYQVCALYRYHSRFVTGAWERSCTKATTAQTVSSLTQNVLFTWCIRCFQVLHRGNSSESQNSEGCSLISDREHHGSELSSEKIQYLQNIRIIQKNLVYIIGLAPSLANESLLRSYSFFGKYGKIKKIILNSNPELVEKVHSCCA